MRQFCTSRSAVSLSCLFKCSLLHCQQLLRRESTLLKFIRLLFPTLNTCQQCTLENVRLPEPTLSCSLWSFATSKMSATYSLNPSCSNALVMCSHAMVFLASFSEISFASDEMSVMNSTQHSMRRSRASLPNATPDEGGRISVTIF